jgi:TolB-like protein
MSRERLAHLLWGSRADEQARNSLRQALAALRKDVSAAGLSPIAASDSRVRLDPFLTEVDAVEFQRLAVSTETEALRAAAALYRGDLLADLDVASPAFEEWVRAERNRLADLAVHALEKLWSHEAGAARVNIAKRLVALDPLRESAHRKLIQAYAEGGENALALRQYEVCRQMLRSEFNLEAGEETEALRRNVLGNLVGRGEAPNPGEIRQRFKPSIAVLPFDVMTAEPELRAFADGLTEDVTTSFSRIKSIRVVARNTMFTFQGRPVDVRNLGRELEAQYVLEGSVRKHGARLRTSAQLIEAASGHHVWAGRLDRESTDIFELQDEITGAIVASVQTQLILNEGRVAAGEAGESVAGLLAQSWQQFLLLNRPSLANCKSLAERALLLDDGSGMAHRMLAVALYHQVYMGFVPWTGAIIDDIYSHARFSIEAEDADEYCHWAMECAHLLRMEHAHAMASLRRALEINPHCSLAHGSIGTVLAWAGEPDAAIKSNERALRMNPDDPTNFFRHLGLALAHYIAARHDQALFHATTVLQMRPQWWLGLLFGAASAAQLDGPDDASRMLNELERVTPGVTCKSLSILPFASKDDREHLLDGLRKAGVPEEA